MKVAILSLLIFFNTFSVYEERFVDGNGVTYSLHHLHVGDYKKGYIELLGQLTECGQINFSKFCLFRYGLNPQHIVLVIENCDQGKIIATGTVLIEPKLIHSGRLVGHIEDIVTDESVRGHGFGKNIVLKLAQYAKVAGCYKVILDCKAENVPFYEKCGFTVKGSEMEIRF
ncbi:MAG: hypothetical protein US13_C0001G0124 [candidate division TM6 bacterium GW2011_GWE2_36_25]|nr:MAG: hypothetical protein US03_C0001G0080 [candidate division TM6 bacterium GW2011_GWF2_36_131]KKQ03784.1 MAG: hypothetical protein US13_C0001G0124 [candidate division TM6 bacterium GW2011_GWE2_36_25]KKQ19930.1 MAG: hypothetical protein US32_C0003G0047 [candidate division TM6 bacterium GW2011_GWA2_36_9]